MSKISTSDLRNKWIKFFESKGHYFIPPKSLIPVNDPSLLWINSGVATLKDYFTGVKNPPSKRIVNCQKSIRTNDIENVGVTARHHTFFEMLGNFSIGDYFKEEAIEFGWEFLTKELNISKDLLYITVFADDEIAYNKWVSLGLNEKHLIKCGRDRNFWDVGQGPCGPCTEIHYDRGIKYDKNGLGEKLFFEDIENDRYVEIWNIVFSQYNNDGHNNYSELARKNIDTGASLERITCALQGVPTNYDTDTFQGIIKKIETLSTCKYDMDAYFTDDYVQKGYNKAFKIIADHIRSATFAIGDGAQPSNKDRGSVIRRLIRRSIVVARKINIEKPFLGEVAKAVVEVMKDFYPELVTYQSQIIETLEKEEKLFGQTLSKGYKLFADTIAKSNKLDPETVFKLSDTYGFPFEVIKELSIEKNIEIDEDKFNEMVIKHQNISRANLEIKGMAVQSTGLLNFKDDAEFIYGQYELNDSNLIGIFDEKFEPLQQSSSACWLVFDKTIFYATSGGQIHDIGTISKENDAFEVTDVIKGPNGQHFIFVDLDGINIKLHDKFNQKVDKKYREAVSKNHSVEHLLEHVLNKYISSNIKQEGAFKSPDKMTFDFLYPTKLTDEQIQLVEDKVNELIASNCEVETDLVTYDEAKERNAVGHFAEVYAKVKGKLRLVKMGGLQEICGGTHVSHLGDIENFLITKVTTKGSGAWRIEAITSKETIDCYIDSELEALQTKITKLVNELIELKIEDKEFSELATEISYKISQKNLKHVQRTFNTLNEIYIKLITKYEKTKAETDMANIKTTAREISNSGNIEYQVYHDQNIKNIINAFNDLVNQYQDHAFVGINVIGGKIQYVICSDKNKKIDAQAIISKINKVSNGTGGGKPDFAQGGSVNLDKIDDILSLLNKE